MMKINSPKIESPNLKQYKEKVYRSSDKPITYNEYYHKDKFDCWQDSNVYNLKGLVAKRVIWKDKTPQGKVLDYGCGIGQISFWIPNIHAYDINQSLYPDLNKKGFTTYNEIKDIPNDFDEIVCSMCLEHIEYTQISLTFLRSKLKDNGTLRLALPGANYPKQTIEEMNTSTDGHYYCWDYKSINYLLNQCGFQVLENRKHYRRGIDRLYWVYFYFGFEAYMWCIKFFGKLFDNFDIIIKARKINKIKRSD